MGQLHEKGICWDVADALTPTYTFPAPRAWFFQCTYLLSEHRKDG